MDDLWLGRVGSDTVLVAVVGFALRVMGREAVTFKRRNENNVDSAGAVYSISMLGSDALGERPRGLKPTGRHLAGYRHLTVVLQRGLPRSHHGRPNILNVTVGGCTACLVGLQGQYIMMLL